MPYTPAAQRAYDRDRKRRKREADKKKRKEAAAGTDYTPPASVGDQVTALTEWAATLSCPPGHPRVGKPMVLPAFLIDYLTGALAARESLLCVARKNAKSTGLALGSPAELLRADASSAARREAWRMCYFGTIMPLARLIESELRYKLESPALTLRLDELGAADLQARARALKSMVDAGVELNKAMVRVEGHPNLIGPGSTVGVALLVNSLKCLVAEKLTQQGNPPIVLTSSYHIGSEASAARFDECFDDYRARVRRVYGAIE